MRSLWITFGIMGMIPLVALAQSPTPSRSVIKPVGFGRVSQGGGCSTCGNSGPTYASGPVCSTVVPAPSCGGNCCPRPCLLEAFRRGLRSLDCLIPCGLKCRSACGSACGSSCGSCSVSCGTASSCTSGCTKSRAHFFAFRKSNCCSPCGDMGCSAGMPMETISPPVPMADDPFKDDNMPPPGRESHYRPYWKKGPSYEGTVPASHRAPTHPDPYAATKPAVTEPVHIKAKPVRVAQARPTAVQPAAARTELVEAYPAVKVASAHEYAAVSMTVSDDDAPPAPPQLLPAAAVSASRKRIDSSIPANPLRR